MKEFYWNKLREEKCARVLCKGHIRYHQEFKGTVDHGKYICNTCGQFSIELEKFREYTFMHPSEKMAILYTGNKKYQWQKQHVKSMYRSQHTGELTNSYAEIKGR